MAEIAIYIFSRIGPRRIPVRIIVRPHTVVLSPPLKMMAGDCIAEKRPEDLALEIFARIFVDRQRVYAFEPIVVIVPLLQHERGPADFVFDADESQLRITV